jgi:hypothetical protein
MTLHIRQLLYGWQCGALLTIGSVVGGVIATVIVTAYCTFEWRPIYLARELFIDLASPTTTPVCLWDGPGATRVIGYVPSTAVSYTPAQHLVLEREWSSLNGWSMNRLSARKGNRQELPTWTEVSYPTPRYQSAVLIIDDARGWPWRCIRSRADIQVVAGNASVVVTHGIQLPTNTVVMPLHPWLDVRMCGGNILWVNALMTLCLYALITLTLLSIGVIIIRQW